VRAGAQALSLLSVPLNVQVLQALREGPKSLIDLRRATGSPPQTTMRATLRTMRELGLLEKRRHSDFPRSVDVELAAPGREMLQVATVLQAWLARSPESPLTLGSPAAKSSIKALLGGWSSGIVRALVARPLSLTELSKLIAGLSYPSLERRLTAMRLAGQIQVCPGEGRGTPFIPGKWLRHATAPLLAAARWERAHLPQQSSPLGKIDLEAAFLLAVPLVSLPADSSGACRLAVELRSTQGSRLAGVLVAVEKGSVVSCVSRLEGKADGWVSGSAGAWFHALLDGVTDQLEIGGDCELGIGLVEGLHDRLFAGSPPAVATSLHAIALP
jgi:DNA-binding HxlR family transcriptional regulator